VAKKMKKKASAKKASPKKVAVKKSVKKTAKKSAPKKAAVAKSKAQSSSAKSFQSEKFQPLDDRVLVQPAGKAEKTAGGIFIPDSVEDRPLQGKVVAIGRGRITKKGNLKPLDVQVGDEVLFAQHTGTAVQLSGNELLLLREEEILGVVR
jgi:chaperonin GroES